MSIFISYSHADKDAAKAIATALTAAGHTVWWDNDMATGKAIAAEIVARIQAASCVVVIWSKDSIASDYVISEAEIARQSGTLFPVRIDNSIPPPPFTGRRTEDLSRWARNFRARIPNDILSRIQDNAKPENPPPEGPSPKASKLIAGLGLALGVVSSVFLFMIVGRQLYSDTPLPASPPAQTGDPTANSTPVARRDHITTTHDTPVTGSLFDPSFQGADYDPDGDAIFIHSVNGATDNVGKTLTLESGATVTVTRDGSFTYDPRTGFAFLTKSGSSSADRVSYSIIDARGGTSGEVLSIFSVKRE